MIMLSRSLVCACVWGEGKQDLGTSNWKAVGRKDIRRVRKAVRRGDQLD